MIIILGMVAMMCGAVAAQEFKAASLWDAKGDVKEIKYVKSDDPMMRSKKMKFSRDGKLNKSVITYDEEGYPYALDFNMMGMSLVVRFTYSPEHDLVKVDMKSNIGQDAQNIVDFKFEDDVMTGESVAAEEFGDKPKKANLEYVFNDYQYDEHQNWIARHVSVKITDITTGKEKILDYTETREIKYWGK